MSKRNKRWLWIGLGIFGVAVAGIFVAASLLVRKFEPYIKQQAKDYLSKRFDSEVEFGSLGVKLPSLPAYKILLTRGRGVITEVTGENIVMRHKGRRDIPPMFAIKNLKFSVDLGKVFDPAKSVALVELNGMEIQIPPKGERPDLGGKDEEPKSDSSLKKSDVFIERVIINDSRLVILPRNKGRKPLDFQLHRVVLDSIQMQEALDYRAELTNPKPPGLINSKGTFGPWNAESPSDTPLAGDYTFENADLGVFKTIAGKLNSKGTFQGTLGAVEAQGEADVPDFRLRMAGHPMHLHTKFQTLVDGTNGNTVLKPVHATLGTTAFTTSGAVLKHEGDVRRSITLDVNMPNGEMMELLTLAMKSKPVMAGRIKMNARITIPPLEGKVKEKLMLDGKFTIQRGQFLQDKVQDKIDTLSRRGQGEPKNVAIGDVFSDMSGDFHMEDQSITFRTLTFHVPGANVDLAGNYDLEGDQLDFAGSLKLVAKVSQTMTGWKRWLLKPVDPIFAKNGAGTFLKVKVSGSSKQPDFSASR